MNAIHIFLAGLPLVNPQDGDSNDAGMKSTAPLASPPTASASPSTHKVDVGEHSFTFDPETFIIAPGETVEFHFYPQNHSVAQTSFDNPCHLANAFDFFSQSLLTCQDYNPVFTVIINDTTPIWYHLGQVDHCQAGMVGVNDASGQEILGTSKQATARAKSPSSTMSATVQGGLLGETEKPSTDMVGESTSQITKPTSSFADSGRSKGNAVGMAIVLVLSCFLSLSMI